MARFCLSRTLPTMSLPTTSPLADNGVLEHESICKALELAVEYDQLNIGELATIELLCRRLQMIQYRWKERVLGASSSGSVDDESHKHLAW